MYPVWRFVSPTYQYLLVRSYAIIAPLVESPRKTLEVRFQDDLTVVVAAEPYGKFRVTTKQLYIDVPILLTLVLVAPGLILAARLRFFLVGGLILATTHFIAQASALLVFYGQVDLQNGSNRASLSRTWFCRRAGCSIRMSCLCCLS